ncbi:TIGR00730 family Rossman fold protein [Heyndrickxia sp. NPDC080065]|uniref:LOG family protein n=1 Tax=Heyndrickxia sp. NPDC080065 TaxID=3390568 RepID=UPI003D08C035
MKRVCVYAGSNLGEKEEYAVQAKELGQLLIKHNLDLVYGGSCVGLMGEVANEVLKNGGNVIGVMPKSLFKGEIVHQGLTELIEVNTMHERKAKMSELSDCFIALPGGYGTFEELFEAICWSQIGIHQKPVGVLNIDHFYDPIIKMVDHAANEGFMNPSNKALLVSAPNALELLEKLINYQRPEMGLKWKQLETTN